MDIISHTNRSKVIRHHLEKPTKIEFIEEDNVVKGINCDSIISLELC